MCFITMRRQFCFTMLWALGCGLQLSTVQAQAPRPSAVSPRNQQETRVAQRPASEVTLDVPPPEMEGRIIPSTEDLIPPSLQGAPSLNPYEEQEEPVPYTENSGTEPTFSIDAPSVMDESYCGGTCADGPAPIYSTGTWFYRGDWFVRSDILVFSRDNPRTPIIGVTEGGIEIPLILSQNSQGDNFRVGGIQQRAAPGLRLGIGRHLGRDAANRDHGFDFKFDGLFEWEVEKTFVATGGNGLVTFLGGGTIVGTASLAPSSVRGFTGFTQHTYTYTADYDSFEASYRVATRPARDQMAMQPDGTWVRFKNASQVCTGLFGLRLTSINEAVTFAAGGEQRQAAQGNDPARYRVLTNNDMFGPQIGGEWTETYDEWFWGLRGKLACLYNFANRRSAYQFPTIPRNEDVERLNQEQVSFIMEVGFFGAYQLRPNLFLRGGYDIAYISGIAQAPENMGLAGNFPIMNVTGDSLMYGASLGFETYW